jgi:hypothetical protein
MPDQRQGVLHEVVGAVADVQPVAAVPAAAEVSPDGRRTVGRGPGGRVPQVGVVEEDVAPLQVEGDLAGDPFEAERHALDVPWWLPGSTRRKPLAGEVGSKWMVKATPGQMSRWGPDWWSVCQPIRE